MRTKPNTETVKPPAPKAALSPPARPRATAAVKAKPPPPPRPVSESCLAAGKLWKMSGRNGVAFVHNAALAGELLQTDPKNLSRSAMAVYYDKKGRAFAWQVRFDTDRWAEVEKRLG